MLPFLFRPFRAPARCLTVARPIHRIFPIGFVLLGGLLLVACGPADGEAPAGTDNGIEIAEGNSTSSEQATGNEGAADVGQPGDSAESGGPTSTPSIQQLATAITLSRGTATAQVSVTAEARAADNVAYDVAVLAEIEETVATLFSGAIGEQDPAWQDVTVRRMSTRELGVLRQDPPPPPDARRAVAGSVWVVAFRTDHPVTPDTMQVDNGYELQSVPAEDLVDADGRTTVYFILSITERGSRLQYTPLARGILPAVDAKWSLEDLAAIDPQ